MRGSRKPACADRCRRIFQHFEEGLSRFCHRTGLELRKCNRHHDLRNRPGRVLLRRESHSGSLRRRLRAKPPNGLTENARREISRRFSISIGPKGICADPAAGPIVSSSTESIRGASVTPRVALGPRKSLAKTLRVSGYHPPRSLHYRLARPPGVIRNRAVNLRPTCTIGLLVRRALDRR